MEEKVNLPTTKHLIRFVLPSDRHEFIGRIFDLSIIAHYFDSYEELTRHADCKYAYDVGSCVHTLTQRIESLNLVGNMLWPHPVPKDFGEFPVSRYDWLTISADVFLMRYVSVIDCVLLLLNAIYETELEPRDCTITKMRKLLPQKTLTIVADIVDHQKDLRAERNQRFHHGSERVFTCDDLTFRTASILERGSNGVTGVDRHGRAIDVVQSFNEALVGLQGDFNQANRKLVSQLDKLYNELHKEFESRFAPRIRVATHGFNRGYSD